MKEMSMKKAPLLVAIVVFILMIASRCGVTPVFNGNRTGNDKEFIMDYTVLNKTDSQEMKLNKDTIVNVEIENKSGRLDIVVTDENGENIYKGDNASSGKFSITIPKDGKYKFSVTGDKAKGSISFKVAQ
jgi:uncharacterized protein YycO